MTRIAIVLLAMGLSLTALMGDDNIIILPEKSGAKGERGKILTKKPLEFTIPQIDLDKREDLQVIISRYKDMYCGHPSSVLLEDGRTMTIMYPNHHGKGFINWKRSFDAGKTWTEHLPVPHDWNNKSGVTGEKVVRDTNWKVRPPREACAFDEVPTLYRVKNPNGKERVLMYTGKGAYARYAVSEDGGATWSKMLPLLFDGERLKETIVLFSDMIRLKNGTYMATFHFPGQVCKAITKDGLSFGKPEVIVQHPKAFLCEACFIRSPDGNKIALLMRENNRSFLSMISFSGDEGKTWTTPREMPASLCGDRHQHVYTPDGRIFVSFRDKGLDSPTWGDWVAWVGTFEDLEEGNEGQYRIRLKDNLASSDCAYPTVKLLPDGTIFAATYGKWYEDYPHAILSFRLTMKELDELYMETVNRE